jgi:hypothetical protein
MAAGYLSGFLLFGLEVLDLALVLDSLLGLVLTLLLNLLELGHIFSYRLWGSAALLPTRQPDTAQHKATAIARHAQPPAPALAATGQSWSCWLIR